LVEIPKRFQTGKNSADIRLCVDAMDLAFSKEHIDTFVIENLFASDLAFLQDLYRRINQDGHTEVAVACPHCNQEFAVDIAGDAPGGS